MRRFFSTICAILALIDASSAVARGRQNETVPRIAAMGLAVPGGSHKYLGDCSEANLARLADAGINTVALWVGYPNVPAFSQPEWWNDPDSLQAISEVADRCAAQKMELYLVTYLGLPTSVYPQVQLILSKDDQGQGQRSPSWLDPAFWEEVILPRDRALAKLAAENTGIQGILLEPEVYQDGALMERGNLDFGDAAYLPFAAQTGLKEPHPPAAERAGFLERQGLTASYRNWQKDRLFEYASKWKTTVREKAPELRLGYYCPGKWNGVWSLQAIAEGLNDPQQSMLILDAGTYAGVGNTYETDDPVESMVDYSRQVASIIAVWGVNAHVAFGIITYPAPTPYQVPAWARTQSAEGITRFLRDCTDAGNGWWIWNEHGNPETIVSHVRQSVASP